MKQKNIIIILTSCLLPYISICLDTNPYTKQARSWVKTHISTNSTLLIPKQDLQLIANLLYFSYYRSKITLDAQEATVAALDTIWQDYENIITTRLNPSRENPHDILVDQQQIIFDHFLDKAPKHLSIGRAYAHATESLIHETSIQSARATKAIQQMRDNARSVVAQSLVDIKQLLTATYSATRSQEEQSELYIEDALLNTRSRGSWFDFLWTYIPQLAMQSFSEADTANTHICVQAWNALQSVMAIGNQTWHAIETARATFYLAHYKAIYPLMESLDVQYKTICFNEDGLLPFEGCLEFLPAPDDLP